MASSQNLAGLAALAALGAGVYTQRQKDQAAQSSPSANPNTNPNINPNIANLPLDDPMFNDYEQTNSQVGSAGTRTIPGPGGSYISKPIPDQTSVAPRARPVSRPVARVASAPVAQGSALGQANLAEMKRQQNLADIQRDLEQDRSPQEDAQLAALRESRSKKEPSRDQKTRAALDRSNQLQEEYQKEKIRKANAEWDNPEKYKLDMNSDKPYKKGGAIKKMASGGMTSKTMNNASKRGDGIASKGRTKGRFV